MRIFHLENKKNIASKYESFAVFKYKKCAKYEKRTVFKYEK